MKGVNPGKYRHSIHIQGPVLTRDPTTGAVERAWATVWLDIQENSAYLPPAGSPNSESIPMDEVPAEVLTGPGRELIAAETKLAETTARINLRWFRGLSPTWRILWDGRVFDILSIETDRTDRREYRLRCKDGLSDGV